jgi:hypothetical protein
MQSWDIKTMSKYNRHTNYIKKWKRRNAKLLKGTRSDWPLRADFGDSIWIDGCKYRPWVWVPYTATYLRVMDEQPNARIFYVYSSQGIKPSKWHRTCYSWLVDWDEIYAKIPMYYTTILINQGIEDFSPLDQVKVDLNKKWYAYPGVVKPTTRDCIEKIRRIYRCNLSCFPDLGGHIPTELTDAKTIAEVTYIYNQLQLG